MAAAATSKHGKGDADSEDSATKLTKDGLFGLLNDSMQPAGATLWDPHLSKDWDMEKPTKECISRIKRCAARNIVKLTSLARSLPKRRFAALRVISDGSVWMTGSK